MKVEVDIQGADGLLKALQSMPSEVVSKRGGPVKLALAKGARLIRDEARRNLAATIGGEDSESTGLLLKSVIASRGKPPSGSKGERYLVRIKSRRYPKSKAPEVKRSRKNRKVAKDGTTLQTGNLKEYGSSRQQATPWLRPAVRSKGQAAIDTIISDLGRRIEKVAADLAKKNGMK